MKAAVKDDVVDDLTRRISGLTLPIQASASATDIALEVAKILRQFPAGVLPMQAGMNASGASSYSQNDDNRNVRFRDPSPGTRERRGSGSSLRPPLLCHLCRDEHMVRDCPQFGQFKDKGQLHLNNQGRVALGPYRHGQHMPTLEFPDGLTKAGRIEFAVGKIREYQLEHSWSDPNPNDERDVSKLRAVRTIRAVIVDEDEGDNGTARLAQARHVPEGYVPGPVHLDPIKRQAREQLSRPHTKQPRTAASGEIRSPAAMATRNTRSQGEIIYDGTVSDDAEDGAESGLYNVQSRDRAA